MSRTVILSVCMLVPWLAGCGDAKSPKAASAPESTGQSMVSTLSGSKSESAPQANQTPKSQATWSPTQKPDPQKIPTEAKMDMMMGHYEDALAKQLWFHHDALKVEPAMYGVRLSFALSDWKQLADVYPPAKVKLIEARDEAEKKVTNGENLVPSFHDVASINSVLGEHQRMVALFKTLETKDAASAAQVFDLARPDLIKAGEIQLCGKYVDPVKDYPRLVTLYHENEKLAADPRFGEHHKLFGQQSFSNGVATLVALLAASDCKSDAEKIAGEAKNVWDDKGFAAELDKALTGKVPAPWPPSIN
jgi:hypothetical protein